ncbi:ferrichrome-iron receptor [Flavobacteriaceae bacterium UJ101]|nr:ferrichrome-iron receptor [Flavobacteriaceae bacterium UJ101]
MKNFNFLLLTICLSIVVEAQNLGNLTGVIKNDKNEGVDAIEVVIKELDKSTFSEKNGYFTFENVPFGHYTLTVSSMEYEVQQIPFEMKETSQALSSIQLVRDYSTVSTVELFGERYKRADKLDVLTRLPLDPNEQIQSISILSHKLIEEQGALTLSDVTRNVAGVYTFATYGNTKESMSMRGFRGVPLLKNGVRVNSDFRGTGMIIDPAGVDNIQVLKGVSAISQGLGGDLGSAGGVINVVTKTPKFYKGGEVSLRTGSWGLFRPTFDFYGPLNEKKNTAFRINGAYERADSYRDKVDRERFYINPSFKWRLDDKTTIIAELDYLDDTRTPDQGTVNLGDYSTNNIYDLPHSQFLGFESDRSTTENTTYALRINRELTDKLSIRGAYFRSDLNTYYENAYSSQMSQTENFNLREREYESGKRDDKNSVIQFDFVGKDIATGKIKHTFQVGMDYKTTKYDTGYASAGVIDTIDVFQPINNVLPSDVSLSEYSHSGATIKSFGIMFQDKITFTDWFDMFVGLRYSSSETSESYSRGTPVAGVVRSDAWNPLIGFNLKPVENVRFFASYVNSEDPRTAGRRDINGNELGNERWDQFETGIKSSWLDERLRFNATYYYVQNKNINMTAFDESGNDLGYYLKGGEDVRQGVELEVIGRVLDNLELIAGYSFLDAKYKEHTYYYYNSAPLNTPKHTANFWTRYTFNRDFLNGLSLGAGIYYLGERPSNVYAKEYTHTGVVPGAKPFDLKSYTTVNLQASYKFNKHFDVSVFANNIFDAEGYNAYRTVYINPIDPVNYSISGRYRF